MNLIGIRHFQCMTELQGLCTKSYTTGFQIYIPNKKNGFKIFKLSVEKYDGQIDVVLSRWHNWRIFVEE